MHNGYEHIEKVDLDVRCVASCKRLLDWNPTVTYNQTALEAVFRRLKDEYVQKER